MKYTNTLLVLTIIVSVMLTGCTTQQNTDTIRLGYMTLWTESGLPAVILKNTEIPQQHNLNIEYVPFQYGPPLIEAALANQVDIIFVGTVPSSALLSKSDDWVIVGRLAYFPKAIMARNGSDIYNVSDLNGKTIGVGFGTGPHPTVLQVLENNNLREKTSVVNMRPADMAAALQTKSVDAIAWGEPSITLFEQQGLADTIYQEEDIGYIVVSKKLVQSHPQQVKEFLQSFKDSMFYLSQNKTAAYKWFSEESQFDISLIAQLQLTEPNYEVQDRTAVDLHVNDTWIAYSQKQADYLYREGVLTKQVSFANAIDESFLK